MGLYKKYSTFTFYLYICIHIGAAREEEKGYAPQDTPKIHFNKKIAPKYLFSAQNPSRRAYSGHSKGRECHPKRNCPQDKFMAMPIAIYPTFL